VRCLDCNGTGACGNCAGRGYHGEMHYDPAGDVSVPDEWCNMCERGACYACYGHGTVAIDSYQNYLAYLESPYAERQSNG
jgi:hypothetical protein